MENADVFRVARSQATGATCLTFILRSVTSWMSRSALSGSAQVPRNRNRSKLPRDCIVQTDRRSDVDVQPRIETRLNNLTDLLRDNEKQFQPVDTIRKVWNTGIPASAENCDRDKPLSVTTEWVDEAWEEKRSKRSGTMESGMKKRKKKDSHENQRRKSRALSRGRRGGLPFFLLFFVSCVTVCTTLPSRALPKRG